MGGSELIDTNEAKMFGINGFITKPILMDTLSEKQKELIDMKVLNNNAAS